MDKLLGREKKYSQRPHLKTIVLMTMVFLISTQVSVGAFSLINVEKLADAIYLAEGGKRTSHPYGILAHYKHTTPRQACINTINHALKDFNGKGDFFSFLGSRYAPTKNCANDPTGLNVNWIKNVKHFYERKQ